MFKALFGSKLNFFYICAYNDHCVQSFLAEKKSHVSHGLVGTVCAIYMLFLSPYPSRCIDQGERLFKARERTP